MPIDAIYSDSALLRGIENKGCVKTHTDISYTSLRGEPVVTDISDRKMCTSDMFKTDQFLANTEGCCVLDTSATNCTDIAGVDAEEENNYYMGLRYFDVANPTYGERKICYTTPIRKKKLHIMELLISVLKDITIFIVMVLVAACYEYWIIYGKCARGGIQTTLYEEPYNIGRDNSTSSTAPKISKPSTIECPDNTGTTSSGPGLEWYDTFPYNLITLLNNNKGNNAETNTSNTFALSELVKIPARSLLLGFFYCIIFSRIAMKGLIGWINKVGSYIYNKEPSKIGKFLSGLIFIVVFMGIYGSLADRFITTKLPFLNASSLFLLALIIILTVWIPSLFGFCIMMLTFVGYRRTSYDRYKNERKSPPEETDTVENWYKLWDWYGVIESFVFTLKRNVVGKESDNDQNKLYKIDNTNNNLDIEDEDILDWFFPIRRSKMEWSCWNQDIADRFKNLFNFDFTSCKNDSNPKFDIGFSKKYYWYLSVFWYEPWQLINPMFTLNVNCDEIDEANAKSSNWGKAFWFYFILTLFIPQIRFYMFLISIVFLIVLMVLILLSSILWTCIVITIVICSIFIALLGNILALFYLHFYVIIGFFYMPFKKYQDLLKIIKSHGNILTLLFCIIVVLAGVKVLHPTSVGVIGGILGLLILYKLITLLSV